MKIRPLALAWVASVSIGIASRQGFAQSAWAVLLLPKGQTIYTYEATATPYRSEDPALSKPIGVGSVAVGGDAVSLQVSLYCFSGTVDIFLALIPPGDPTDSLWLLREDGGLQPMADGMVPWKRGVTAQINESLLGYVPVSWLPEGTYGLFLAVTPSGDGLVNHYYAWATSFEIGQGAQDDAPAETETTSVKVSTWVRTFGGVKDDYAYVVRPTSDGGFVAAGRTSSTEDGSADATLVKTDPSGVVQWERVFGGADWDEATAVQETSDGGFVVVGSTRSFGGGGSDYLMIRTDAAGNELWATALGGPGDEFALSVIETADGKFVVSGQTSSVRGTDYDLSLVKTDPQGTLLWARSYGGIRDEGGYSVLERSGGGFIVAGYTGSPGHGMEDVYFICTDEVGELVWDLVYGGEGNERGQAMIQTTDGAYVIAG
jgi:hypothetical protein